MTRAVRRGDGLPGQPTEDQSDALAVTDHAQKKLKRAEEQLRDDIPQARKDCQEAQHKRSVEDIIVVDEMGCVTGMSRV